MGIFQVEIVRVGVILGGNFPGESYTGWEFSLVRVFRVRIVRWESSGWQFSGWQFSCYLYFVLPSGFNIYLTIWFFSNFYNFIQNSYLRLKVSFSSNNFSVGIYNHESHVIT